MDISKVKGEIRREKEFRSREEKEERREKAEERKEKRTEERREERRQPEARPLATCRIMFDIFNFCFAVFFFLDVVMRLFLLFVLFHFSKTLS